MGTNFFDFKDNVTRKPAQPAADPAGAKPAEPLTVSQLTAWIDRAIRTALPQAILVKGEVSNYKVHPNSGHVYFTMKDKSACIDCVMWKSDAARLKFRPDDGMELLAGGRVDVFPKRGTYQLYVGTLRPLGQGALELAFQQMKAKLEAEGLFAPEHRRQLPRYPLRIVLVTSSGTAALQDMLKVLRRFPWLVLYVYHVPVQGEGCGAKIAAALSHLNRHAASIGAELIMLGRGGGSIENLWAFNEEGVARAVAGSMLPVITGIGHEVDTTIADLAADYHAHTPTEAAQVVTMHWRAVRESTDVAGVRLRRGLRAAVEDARQRLAGVERHEVFRRPLDRLKALAQLLDDRQRTLSFTVTNHVHGLQRDFEAVAAWLDRNRPAIVMARFRDRVAACGQRLAAGMAQRLRRAEEHVGSLNASLSSRHPRHRLTLEAARLDSMQGLLRRAAGDARRRAAQRLAAMQGQLDALSPEAVLRRGYSITFRNRNGVVVRSAAELSSGDRILTKLVDGEIQSIVQDSQQLPLFE